MYNKSKYFMGATAALSTCFGINAYLKTREKLWLYGSLAVFSIIPFTFAAIMEINK
jgi:hypothetical protein